MGRPCFWFDRVVRGQGALENPLERRAGLGWKSGENTPLVHRVGGGLNREVAIGFSAGSDFLTLAKSRV